LKLEKREELTKQFHELEEQIARTKGAEYADDVDTLSNFKIIARLINETVPMTKECPNCSETVSFEVDPLLVLAIYFMKHTLAFMDYIGRKESLSETLKERVLDIRVYAFLAYCLAVEHE